jgi:FixJ family two-component response regulator
LRRCRECAFCNASFDDAKSTLCQALLLIQPLGNTTLMKNSLPTATLTVAVIEDDDGLRDSIEFLLRSVEYSTIGFPSAAAFNLAELTNRPDCLIVDVRLPGLSGLELQAQLADAGTDIPIVFVSGYADIPMASRAMKAGAVDFLTKPFRDQDLLDAVSVAIDRNRASTEQEKTMSTFQSAFSSLTVREREVTAYVAAGLVNKQIAANMGLSEVTVKVHRGNAMHKLGVRSIPDLVRLVDAIGTPRP